jgi:TetR/AcrR family transcriptional regulator, fatty acid biosynthesis regulator
VPGSARSQSAPPGRRLRRAEAKELTRARLVAAAMDLLNSEGGSRLSASAISRKAGVAQSTFYVHFHDLPELLRALGDELAVRRGVAVREARRKVREQPDAERVRETFRIPLEEMTSNPDWYQMGLRVRHDPSSPLGDVVREMLRREREDLVDDLRLAGYDMNTAAGERGARMIADCLAAMTESLAQGHVEGRYPDVEEILDVLVRIFFEGVASSFPLTPAPSSAGR